MTGTTRSELQLLETFERLTLDQVLHFFLDTETGERVHVEFCRSDEKPWTAFLVGHRETSSRTVSRRKIGTVLTALGSSLESLESEVAAHLLMQAGYCDHFIREVGELLGQNAVRQSILGTQRLMDDLATSVKQALGPSTGGSAPLPADIEDQVTAGSPSDSATPRGMRTKLRIIRD